MRLPAITLLERAKLENDMDAKMKMVDDAITHFDISLNKKQNPEAYSNKGLAELMKSENNYKALSMFTSGLQASPSSVLSEGINAMKGVSEIKVAKYNDAVNSFANANEDPVTVYNSALAQLLKKDFGTAKTEI